MFDQLSDGQIIYIYTYISTSAEVTPTRGLGRKSPLIHVWQLWSFAQNAAFTQMYETIFLRCPINVGPRI